MKKLTVLTLVFILLVVSAVPAFAAGGPPSGRGMANGNSNGSQVKFGVNTPYELSGVISGIDAVNHTVTVTVACGNRLVKPYYGLEVTLQTGANTRFLLRVEEGTAIPISFEDLAVGQNISSHGTLVEGTWSATRITVGALLTCLP